MVAGGSTRTTWAVVATAGFVVVLAFAWMAFPLTLPAEAFDVQGLEAEEIQELKQALAQANVAVGSDTHGGVDHSGFFSLDCGGLPVASVWDFDGTTRISIHVRAEERFPKARPAIRQLRRVAAERDVEAVEGARHEPLSAFERFVFRHREGKDPDARCD